jgi:hypothetical protein
MLPSYSPTQALAAILAAATGAAVAAPSPHAGDLHAPIARDAAVASAQKHGRALTGGVHAPDRVAPDAATPFAPTTGARAPNAPTVVEITPARGFDWTSAGIGAGGGIALTLIALAGAATVSSRSRPASH